MALRIISPGNTKIGVVDNILIMIKIMNTWRIVKERNSGLRKIEIKGEIIT